MFKHEARLLGPVRFDQSGCQPTEITACITAHQVSAYVGPRSPGDMLISPNIQSELEFPGAGVWTPLETGFTGTDGHSAAQEPLAVHTVVGSVLRQLGE